MGYSYDYSGCGTHFHGESKGSHVGGKICDNVGVCFGG